MNGDGLSKRGKPSRSTLPTIGYPPSPDNWPYPGKLNWPPTNSRHDLRETP
jgi:hypothetical protein